MRLLPPPATAGCACDICGIWCEYCGGMGNMLMMGHAGFLSHEDTLSNLELYSKHVMPRLKAYKQPEPQTAAA